MAYVAPAFNLPPEDFAGGGYGSGGATRPPFTYSQPPPVNPGSFDAPDLGFSAGRGGPGAFAPGDRFGGRSSTAAFSRPNTQALARGYAMGRVFARKRLKDFLDADQFGKFPMPPRR